MISRLRRLGINISFIMMGWLIIVPSVLWSVKQRKPTNGTVSSAESSSNTDTEASPMLIERVITSGHLWQPVQKRAQDTVVQVISQVAAINLLRPYESPNQGTMVGSGFFISDQGVIATNAHVINEAAAIWIQIPSLGKQIIDVSLIGMAPDRDLALLQVSPEGLEIIRRELGSVPFLPLGDSDMAHRSDDVLALGYPLGQQSLKSTSGVISGFERRYIQTSAPINPGNSGGPLVNIRGEVIGINSAAILEAQNVGYAIPVNELKIIMPDLYKNKLLRRPQLGIVFSNGTEALAQYLNNPPPGGCPVVGVLKNSPLDQAGIQCGDMIYAIDGYPVDLYGEMRVPWSEDKVSVADYASRLQLGKDVHITFYRNGMKKEVTVPFTVTQLPAVHEVFPGYEEIDYEIIAGMVITPLSLNQIPLLNKRAPGLDRFMEGKNQENPVLLVTHVFPSSQLARARALQIGSIISEVDGVRVRTLAEFRDAIKASVHKEFLVFKAIDTVSQRSENVLIALSWSKVLDEEERLSFDFRYQMTPMTRSLVRLKREKPQQIGIDRNPLPAPAC